MSNVIPVIPEMEIGLVVVTPVSREDITANKKYVVEKIGEGVIFIKNDFNCIVPHSSYQFIEADVYFTMCLFSTMITIFKLGSKAYK